MFMMDHLTGHKHQETFLFILKVMGEISIVHTTASLICMMLFIVITLSFLASHPKVHVVFGILVLVVSRDGVCGKHFAVGTLA